MSYRNALRTAGAAAIALSLASFSLVAATAAVADDVVPVGSMDEYSMVQGTTLSVDEPGVLGNDQCDGVKTVAWMGDFNSAEMMLNTAGWFTFTPAPDFVGTSHMTYMGACDGVANAAYTDIWVTVVAEPVVLNSAPIAVPDSYTSPLDQNVYSASSILANDSDADGDAISIVGASGAEAYLLTFNADGTFVMTAPVGYTGIISFTYEITDGTAFASAQVDVAFSATVVSPEVPSGTPDAYWTPQNTLLTVAPNGVLANDTGAVAVVDVTDVPAGLTPEFDGSFTYLPPTDFLGTVHFSYRMSNGSDTLSEWIDVTITVTEPAVEEPEEPVTPVDPEEPVTPVTPEDPEEPVIDDEPVVTPELPTEPVSPEVPDVQSAASSDSLAHTGATNDWSLLVPASALLALGGAALITSRRRSSTK